jgi:hypothetical protein
MIPCLDPKESRLAYVAIFPQFGESRGPKDKDWNDLAKRFGIEAVRTQIQEGLAG